jgi:hypothetical protein
MVLGGWRDFGGRPGGQSPAFAQPAGCHASVFGSMWFHDSRGVGIPDPSTLPKTEAWHPRVVRPRVTNALYLNARNGDDLGVVPCV